MLFSKSQKSVVSLVLASFLSQVSIPAFANGRDQAIQNVKNEMANLRKRLSEIEGEENGRQMIYRASQLQFAMASLGTSLYAFSLVKNRLDADKKIADAKKSLEMDAAYIKKMQGDLALRPVKEKSVPAPNVADDKELRDLLVQQEKIALRLSEAKLAAQKAAKELQEAAAKQKAHPDLAVASQDGTLEQLLAKINVEPSTVKTSDMSYQILEFGRISQEIDRITETDKGLKSIYARVLMKQFMEDPTKDSQRKERTLTLESPDYEYLAYTAKAIERHAEKMQRALTPTERMLVAEIRSAEKKTATLFTEIYSTESTEASRSQKIEEVKRLWTGIIENIRAGEHKDTFAQILVERAKMKKFFSAMEHADRLVALSGVLNDKGVHYAAENSIRRIVHMDKPLRLSSDIFSDEHRMKRLNEQFDEVIKALKTDAAKNAEAITEMEKVRAGFEPAWRSYAAVTFPSEIRELHRIVSSFDLIEEMHSRIPKFLDVVASTKPDADALNSHLEALRRSNASFKATIDSLKAAGNEMSMETYLKFLAQAEALQKDYSKAFGMILSHDDIERQIESFGRSIENARDLMVQRERIAKMDVHNQQYSQIQDEHLKKIREYSIAADAETAASFEKTGLDVKVGARKARLERERAHLAELQSRGEVTVEDGITILREKPSKGEAKAPAPETNAPVAEKPARSFVRGGGIAAAAMIVSSALLTYGYSQKPDFSLTKAKKEEIESMLQELEAQLAAYERG